MYDLLIQIKMRILHTSDWHLGRNIEQISRISEQSEFIDCLCGIADEEKIDLVLIAGDIFDTYNPSAAAEELFYDGIERLNQKGKRAVIVIAGNHDNPERLCASSPLAYKNGIILLGYPKSDPGDYRIDTTGIKMQKSGPGWMELCLSGCDHNAVIITLPYPSEARLEEVLSKQAKEKELQKAYSDRIGELLSGLSENFRDDTVNLVVSHLFLMGGKESDSERTLQVGGAMTASPAVMPERVHYAALGHLHRPQEIKSALCPAFYSGSPLAYSFSEDGHSKAVFIIDSAPQKKTDIRPIYLNCGKPLKKWFAKDGINQAIHWCEEGRDKNAWIDLEIVTNSFFTVEEQKKLRALNPGIINIRPMLKTEETEKLQMYGRENKKIDELFKDYYTHKTGTEIPEELMRSFIEIINDDDGQDTDYA